MNKEIFKKYIVNLRTNLPVAIFKGEEIPLFYGTDRKRVHKFTEKYFLRNVAPKLVDNIKITHFEEIKKDFEKNEHVLYSLTPKPNSIATGHVRGVKTLYWRPLKSSMEYYIPGSSLKGAIRKALTYYYYKNNPEAWEKVKEKIKKAIEDGHYNLNNNKKNKKVSNFVDKIFETHANGSFANKDIMKTFPSAGSNANSNRRSFANKDIMKTIRISDSFLKEYKTPIIANIVVVKDNGNLVLFKNKEGGKEFVSKTTAELIPEGVNFYFDVTVDVYQYKQLIKLGKCEICPDDPDEFVVLIKKALEMFSKDYKDRELSYLKSLLNNSKGRFYKDNSFIIGKVKNAMNNSNIRLGYGSSLNSTSLIMLLDKKTASYIRDFAIDNKQKNRGNIAVPYTRKWIVASRIFREKKVSDVKLYSTLGWAKVEFEKA